MGNNDANMMIIKIDILEYRMQCFPIKFEIWKTVQITNKF